MSDIMERISAAEEVVWINPNLKPAAEALATIEYTAADVEDAAKRLERFAPLIMHYFPETKETNGIIESPLTEIPNMKAVPQERQRPQGCRFRKGKRRSLRGSQAL